MAGHLIIPKGNVEYLRADVTSTDGTTLDAPITVQLCIVVDDAEPAGFVAASWQGTAGTTRVAQSDAVHTYSTSGKHQIYAKLTDAPEAPIVLCGTVTVTP